MTCIAVRMPVLIAICLPTATVLADFVAYEHSRHVLGGGNKAGVVTAFPAKWVGQALNLSPATPSLAITGIDAGLHFEGNRHYNAGEVRIRVRIYDTFIPAGPLVFSNLISEEVVVSQTAFTGALPGFSPANYPVGLTPNTPYWKFNSTVQVSSFGAIGIAYTFETLQGGVWASDPALCALSYGSVALPTVGSSAMAQGTGLFRSSISSPTWGNFEPTDYQNPTFADPGAFGGLDVRIWTAVPVPSSFGLLVAAASALTVRRRR